MGRDGGVRYGDLGFGRGEGGETHQVAGDGRRPLTTQQGVVVSDDQNRLAAGARGPKLVENARRVPGTAVEAIRVDVSDKVRHIGGPAAEKAREVRLSGLADEAKETTDRAREATNG